MKYLAAAALLIATPVFAQSYTFPADKAGNEITITIKPGTVTPPAVLPVSPKVGTIYLTAHPSTPICGETGRTLAKGARHE